MASRDGKQDFVYHVVELLQALGPVNSKRMFGGYGVFLDGLMFGLIANNELYFKADEDSRRDFVELGLQPFTYTSQGTEKALSYYQAPEETLESMEEMTVWGNRGFACALRAASKKKTGKSKKTKR